MAETHIDRIFLVDPNIDIPAPHGASRFTRREGFLSIETLARTGEPYGLAVSVGIDLSHPIENSHYFQNVYHHGDTSFALLDRLTTNATSFEDFWKHVKSGRILESDVIRWKNEDGVRVEVARFKPGLGQEHLANLVLATLRTPGIDPLRHSQVPRFMGMSVSEMKGYSPAALLKSVPPLMDPRVFDKVVRL